MEGHGRKSRRDYVHECMWVVQDKGKRHDGNEETQALTRKVDEEEHLKI